MVKETVGEHAGRTSSRTVTLLRFGADLEVLPGKLVAVQACMQAPSLDDAVRWQQMVEAGWRVHQGRRVVRIGDISELATKEFVNLTAPGDSIECTAVHTVAYLESELRRLFALKLMAYYAEKLPVLAPEPEEDAS
jgi:hypothetical protein